MNISPNDDAERIINQNSQLMPPKKTILVDAHRYQEMLDMTDLTEQQRSEILNTLWSMIITLIDFGYLVHAVEKEEETNISKVKQGAKNEERPF